jgi:hypothetical protein
MLGPGQGQSPLALPGRQLPIAGSLEIVGDDLDYPRFVLDD